MLKQTLLIPLFLLPLVFAGVAHAETVATVNGEKISQEEFQQYRQYRQQAKPKDSTNQNPQAVLNEMINRTLLYQIAKEKGLDKQSNIEFLLKQQKMDLMIQALLQSSDVGKPVSENEIKAFYDERVGAAGGKTEYNARHILLESKADAETVIAQLDSGTDFAELAKEKSTGPSAKDGGSLGWFNPKQMVPPFAQAVAELEKGKYTKEPVKTEFGWHVIKLEDKRETQPPSYEDVKGQIGSVLRNQRLQEFVLEQRNNAKIDINEQAVK